MFSKAGGATKPTDYAGQSGPRASRSSGKRKFQPSSNYPTIVRSVLLSLLLCLILTMAAHPAPAAAQTGTLDLERIDAFVREQVQRHDIPGVALGIVEGDRIVHMSGFGKSDETGRAVTPQTPFILASTSKPITALAAMQLVEAGKVDLDAPVQRYLPAFRFANAAASAQITVRQLFNHTSGMPATSCDTKIDSTTLEQYVAELQTVALDFPPGTRYSYCSGNYNVLGRIIEVVSGQQFGTYIQQQVFAPLNMHHSFTSEQQALQDGLAGGYQWLFGLKVPTHHQYNSSQLPSGYLISSAEDMSHFLVAQLNGGRYGSGSVLSPGSIAAMHAPGVDIAGGKSKYGLGWKTGLLAGIPAIHHDGVNFNYHSLLFIQPETGRGAVLLMNSFGMVPSLSSYKELEDGLVQLVAGQVPAPTSSLNLGTLYLIIDVVLALPLVLALWPLLALRRWDRQLRQRQQSGRLRVWQVGLRLVWEFGFPLSLLIVTRLLLHMMGAQSWAEGLAAFPDFGLWVWLFSLVMLLTAATRLALLARFLRDRAGQPAVAAAAVTQPSHRPA